ncbi:hypothetical protein B9Z55_022862 [Caenorhabditis nigoni]|uniref:Protein kinase domain-containing protein n=1 Tax=Caenorhabditis nigoni TaxID=1611254 RepID=A0A2G5SMA9_9PELO|nr:hypothetical protein B9Z55_022862 [Caenorhabditis nigoni]
MTAVYKCPYDNLLILNIATTCEERNFDYPLEIIQFSIVVIDTRTKTIREDVKFNRYVRPIINPMLTDYCKSYTGIAQATVDTAEPFPVVCEQFCEWLQVHDFQETRYAFVALNRQDLWLVAQYQFLLTKQPLPAMFRQWFDMNALMTKAHQGQYTSRPEEDFVQNMSDFYSIRYEGKARNALDNCEFLAKVTKRFLDDGNLVTVNEILKCFFGVSISGVLFAIMKNDFFQNRNIPLTVDPEWGTKFISAMEVHERILPLIACHTGRFFPEDHYGMCHYCKQPASVCTGREHKQYPKDMYEQLREPSVFAITAGLVKEQNDHFGHYVLNRYRPTGKFKEAGVQGRAVAVFDILHNRDGLIMKRIMHPEDYHRELTVLQAMRGQAGFPHLHDFFTTPAHLGGVQYFLVMDYEGECLDDVSRRTDRGISNYNLMRITYKLFWTLESLHIQGYCHRDVHARNVVIRQEFDGLVRIKLIDFGMSLPLDPSPMPDRNLTSWHASLEVCRGDAYSRFDDLTSALFVAMWCIRLNPFGEDHGQYLTRKVTFDANPLVWFTKELKWIGKLYNSIQLQRSSGYSHTDMFDNFHKWDPEFDPTSPITHSVIENQLRIE